MMDLLHRGQDVQRAEVLVARGREGMGGVTWSARTSLLQLTSISTSLWTRHRSRSSEREGGRERKSE